MYADIRNLLIENPPTNWQVLSNVDGAGVYLLHKDLDLKTLESGTVKKLVGPYQIVFEFFCLTTSGEVKISARVAGKDGTEIYNHFNKLAKDCRCPPPDNRGQDSKDTKSVASWPKDRKKFDTNQNRANWIRNFLNDSTHELNKFISEIRSNPFTLTK